MKMCRLRTARGLYLKPFALLLSEPLAEETTSPPPSPRRSVKADSAFYEYLEPARNPRFQQAKAAVASQFDRRGLKFQPVLGMQC